MSPLTSRFTSHLDSNLVRLRNHLYLSVSDPRYEEKFTRYGKHISYEAHYKLGQKFEKQGMPDKALYHYRECIKTYPSDCYHSAVSKIKRVERALPKEEQHANFWSLSSVLKLLAMMIGGLLLVNLVLVAVYILKERLV